MSSIIRLISFTTFLVLNGMVMAYGSVLHSVGIARGVDSTVSYIEHHQYLESGQHLIRYYDNGLRLLVTKELSYPDLPQHPTLKQTDVLRQTEITIETEKMTAVMTQLSLKDWGVFEFELSEEVIIDAGFDAYIRANWGSFEHQPVQQFRFAVAGHFRLIQMEVSSIDSGVEGATFTVTPKNWLIRLILPTISLSYDTTRQLARYQGFSNLKQTGEKRNVVINFKHYEMQTPLSMPLFEWLPQVSGR
jgi:hypothetical protein